MLFVPINDQKAEKDDSISDLIRVPRIKESGVLARSSRKKIYGSAFSRKNSYILIESRSTGIMRRVSFDISDPIDVQRLMETLGRRDGGSDAIENTIPSLPSSGKLPGRW